MSVIDFNQIFVDVYIITDLEREFYNTVYGHVLND